MSIVEAVLLNKEDFMRRTCRALESSDWFWDWHARSNDISVNDDSDTSSICHLKEYESSYNNQQQQQQHPCEVEMIQRKKLTLRHWAIRHGFFSKEILSMLLFSNLLSLVLGAGIGYSVLIRRTV